MATRAKAKVETTDETAAAQDGLSVDERKQRIAELAAELWAERKFLRESSGPSR
jgi:hypothetical protein